MGFPLNNYQPTVVVNEVLAMDGVYPPNGGGGGGGMTIGMFHDYAFNFSPPSAPSAQGQLVSISQNTALFSILGTTYGGNGQSTFALPDLIGRTAVSQGQGPGLTDVLLGEATGSATIGLLQSQMPSVIEGTSAAANDIQPELGVRYLIRSFGIYPWPDSGGASLNLIGSVVKFAGNFTPDSYFECNGQLVDIGSNDVLFSLIGTTYGGDGVTNFAVPDLRGRTVVGASDGLFLGQTLGQENLTITQNNLPVAMGGGGQPLENHQPSLVLNYAISLQGIYPSSDGGGADAENPFFGEIITFAGNFAPRGYALCQGQLLSINANQELFSLLGTTYGGDGQTTFALPDLRGRVIAGQGSGFVVGDVFGSSTITVTLDNIPDLTFSGTTAAEMLYGGNGNDNINGQSGDDTLTGLAGNDTLNGGNGEDTLFGGEGDDTLIGSAQGDMLDGGANGAGGDTVSYFGSTAGVTVNLLTNTASGGHATGDVISGFENVTGSAEADNLTGDAGDNILAGSASGDTLEGGANGAGGDTLSYAGSIAGVTVSLHANTATDGHATGDVISGFENVLGSSRSDSIAGDANANVLDGALGTGDRLNYAGSNAGVIINLTTNTASGGHATGDTITGFERVIGSGFDDQLTGTEFANNFSAGNGNDIVFGGAGVDTMNGGNGFDRLDYTASAGGVTINLLLNTASGGDAAGDVFSFFERVNGSSGGVDFLTGNAGVNILNGNGGNDTIEGGAGADTLDGGLGTADTLSYSTSNLGVAVNIGLNTASGGHATGDIILNFERLTGSGFSDTLIGSNGTNTILGGAGIDTIDGAAGGDLINGGLGNDFLIGGTGLDKFIFTDVAFGNDTITDWIDGQDKIDVTALGLTHASFVETQSGADTLLTNGATSIRLVGILATTIDQGDFI